MLDDIALQAPSPYSPVRLVVRIALPLKKQVPTGAEASVRQPYPARVFRCFQNGKAKVFVLRGVILSNI